VCWWLLLAWVGVHVAALLLSGAVRPFPGPWWTWGGPSLDVLLRLGAMSPALVRLGDTHRLLTYAFLHAYVLHLLLNAWVFLAVGRLLESVVGSSRTWIVFVVSALGGGVAHVLVGGAPMVGASGGVFGVVGALGLWSLRADHPQAKAARATALIFLCLSAALFFLPGVANDAHVGGLVAGVLVMAVMGPRRAEGAPGTPTRAVAFALLAVTLVAAGAQALGGPSGSAAAVRAFLQDLRETERLGETLYADPVHAREEKRQELGRRLDALRKEAPLEGREDAAAALDAYLDAWRPVADADVPDPFRFEARLEAARRAWRPHRDRLASESGAAP